MIKALLFIFDSAATWERVVAARHRIGYILTIYLLPMLVLAGAAEGSGLVCWGKWQPGLSKLKSFAAGEVMAYEAAQLLLNLVVVFVAAHIVKTLSETFQDRTTHTQTFTLVAYGLSPVFLLRLLDAFPMMSPWIPWIIGILLSIWILYQGLPRILLPDPTHAFGLYLMTSLVLLLITGLSRLLTALYLQGSVDFAHSYLGRKIAHLLGGM